MFKKVIDNSDYFFDLALKAQDDNKIADARNYYCEAFYAVKKIGNMDKNQKIDKLANILTRYEFAGYRHKENLEKMLELYWALLEEKIDRNFNIEDFIKNVNLSKTKAAEILKILEKNKYIRYLKNPEKINGFDLEQSTYYINDKFLKVKNSKKLRMGLKYWFMPAWYKYASYKYLKLISTGRHFSTYNYHIQNLKADIESYGLGDGIYYGGTSGSMSAWR